MLFLRLAVASGPGPVCDRMRRWLLVTADGDDLGRPRMLIYVSDPRNVSVPLLLPSRNDGKSRRDDRGSGESQAAMRRAADGVREGSHWRSGLIALCLSANLIVATPAAAQTAPGSTAVTSPLSIVHDDDHVVLDPGEPAFAGDDLPTTLRLPLVTHVWPPQRFAGNVRDGTFGQQRLPSRDSLRNGAIIGTVIGAAALGAFAATLCNAYQEEGGASCLPDTLRIAAIGGAIGLGAGLAIDAARSQSGVTVFVAIRF